MTVPVHVVSGAHAGSIFTLEGEPVLVGRSKKAGIRMDPLEDGVVSKRHALLVPSASGWAVRDLGSSNGTFVNDVRVKGAVALADGDLIRLGSDGPVLAFNPSKSLTVPVNKRISKSADGVRRPNSGWRRFWPWVVVLLTIASVG